MADTDTSAELLICIKCRVQDASADDETRPGQHLYEALKTQAQGAAISVRPVECLSNCSRGCSIALRAAGKWSYVYGNLTPQDAPLVLEGAHKYHTAADGLVPWRERPEHFRKNCIARIPPLET